MLRRDDHGLLAVRQVKLLAAFAIGTVVAYGFALYALTDWLEIDWRIGP